MSRDNLNDDFDCCLYIEGLRIQAMLGRCTLREEYSECAVCGRTEGPFEPHWWDEPPADGERPQTIDKVVQDVITVCPPCHRRMTRHVEHAEKVAAGIRIIAEIFKATGAETLEEAFRT